jgi:hypothetical protein
LSFVRYSRAKLQRTLSKLTAIDEAEFVGTQSQQQFIADALFQFGIAALE